MGRTRGAGAGGERDLQSPVRASDGETAPGQAKIAMGEIMFVTTPHPWESRIGRVPLRTLGSPSKIPSDFISSLK